MCWRLRHLEKSHLPNLKSPSHLKYFTCKYFCISESLSLRKNMTLSIVENIWIILNWFSSDYLKIRKPYRRVSISIRVYFFGFLMETVFKFSIWVVGNERPRFWSDNKEVKLVNFPMSRSQVLEGKLTVFNFKVSKGLTFVSL